MRRRGLLVVSALLVLPAPASAATLGGRVWSDRDADGLRDRDEVAVRAVPVELQRRSGRTFRTIRRTVTSGTGAWSFTVTRTGTYRARLTPPVGTRIAPRDRDRRDRLDSDVTRSGRTALTPARRLTRRGRSYRFDMGLVPPPVRAPVAAPAPAAPAPAPAAPAALPPAPIVGDRVWNDLDGDGVQGADEPGVAGVTVETWDTAMTTRLAGTTTDADGRWSLPAPAAVRVRIVLPAGAAYAVRDVGADDARDSDVWQATDVQGFTSPVTGAPGRTDVDAGVRFPGTVAIGDFVWDDGNADGIQQGGEPGLPGRTIELWNESLTQRLGTTTSAVNGSWQLAVPRGLRFRLRARLASGDVPTLSDAGADDGLDSDFAGADELVALTPAASVNAAAVTFDLGVQRRLVIVGRVWRDANGNGRRDPGEAPVAGASVQVWNGAKTSLVQSTSTTAAGTYRIVRGAAAGTVRIRVLLPGGATAFTVKDAAGDDALDSDINPGGADFGFTDALDASSAVHVPDVDAGVTP